jgi:hypothetical protein
VQVFYEQERNKRCGKRAQRILFMWLCPTLYALVFAVFVIASIILAHIRIDIKIRKDKDKNENGIT